MVDSSTAGLHGGRVSQVAAVDRYADEVHVEVVGGLGQGCVAAGRTDHRGPGDPALVAGDVPPGLDRLEQALGATRGEETVDLAARSWIVCAEQAGSTAHEVVAEQADARERQHVQAVLGGVQAERVHQELVVLIAGRVHEAEDPPTPPVLVVRLALGERGENRVFGDPFFRYWGMGEAVGRCTHKVQRRAMEQPGVVPGVGKERSELDARILSGLSGSTPVAPRQRH